MLSWCSEIVIAKQIADIFPASNFFYSPARFRGGSCHIESWQWLRTLPYLCAYVPVSSEWNIMIVSSKSHTNTRSRSDSGPGEAVVRPLRLPVLLLRLLRSVQKNKSHDVPNNRLIANTQFKQHIIIIL